MRIRGAMMSIIFLFALSLTDGAAQDMGSADFDMYQSFLGQVAQLQLKPAVGMVLLNGETINGETPSQWPIDRLAATGLTEAEQKTLHAIATDWEAKRREIDLASGSLIFERRMETLEAAKEDPAVTSRLAELEDRKDRLLRDHLEQLKGALGPARFELLNDYIRARRHDASFFPPLVAGRPPVKRASKP